MPFFSTFNILSDNPVSKHIARVWATVAMLGGTTSKDPPVTSSEAAPRGRMFGYASSATGNQAQLDRQVEEIERYAADKSEKLAGIFIDRAVGGGCADRPGFLALRGTLRTGDVLIVTDVDRIARNSSICMEVYHALRLEGIALHVVGTGPVQLINLFLADHARDQFQQRMAAGRRAAKLRRGSVVHQARRNGAPEAKARHRKRD